MTKSSFRYSYFVVEGMSHDGSSDAGPEGRTLAEAKKAARDTLKETLWADWVHVWGYRNDADYPDLLVTYARPGYKDAAKREAALATNRMRRSAQHVPARSAQYYEDLGRRRP